MPRFFKVYGQHDPALEERRMSVEMLQWNSITEDVRRFQEENQARFDRIVAAVASGQTTMEVVHRLAAQETMRILPPSVDEWYRAFDAMLNGRPPHFDPLIERHPYIGVKSRWVWPADVEVVAAVDWRAPEITKNPRREDLVSRGRLLGPMEFKD